MFRWHSALLSPNVVLAKVQHVARETRIFLKLTVTSPENPVQYWLFPFKPTKKSHPSDLSKLQQSHWPSLMFFLFLPLSVVPGGWRWRGNAMQRKRLERDGALRGKTRFTPGWLYTAALLSVHTHTHTHTNEHTSTCVCARGVGRRAHTVRPDPQTHARKFRAAYELCTSIPAAV